MKKILIPILVLIAFVFGMPNDSMARKGNGHYKHHHGHYKKHNYYNRGYNRPYAYQQRNYIYYAPPPPVVYAPPPVVYAPPPVYGPGYYGPSSGGYLNFGIVFD